MLCNLALISADSQIERRSSEAGRSVRGCSEWLAGHLTVGYQRDNNVWRQAGAMYVLQKNNCYPFKSHFLIGLAVVEGNLERRQVRERAREREGGKELGDEKERERASNVTSPFNGRYQLLSPHDYASEGPSCTYQYRSVGALLSLSLINRKITQIPFCVWIQGQGRVTVEAVFFSLYWHFVR